MLLFCLNLLGHVLLLPELLLLHIFCSSASLKHLILQPSLRYTFEIAADIVQPLQHILQVPMRLRCDGTGEGLRRPTQRGLPFEGLVDVALGLVAFVEALHRA